MTWRSVLDVATDGSAGSALVAEAGRHQEGSTLEVAGVPGPALEVEPAGRRLGSAVSFPVVDSGTPLDEPAIVAMAARRQALERDAGGWRRMARSAADERWRAACTAQAEEAEQTADGIREHLRRTNAATPTAEQEAER
jgi:hypothetical protein